MLNQLNELFQSANLDGKSLEFLNNAIKAQALQGFDYLKFKQSIKALQDMNMSEEMAIRSAFSTASTMGITKQKILENIQHYQGVLNKEKSEFDSALQKQTNTRINQKQNETSYLQEKIKAHQAQILELEKQIKEFQFKIDNADKEIEEARQKILDTKERFEETYTHYMDVLRSDIEIFNKYL